MYLRIRKNTAHDNLCHVWLIGIEGVLAKTEHCLMHGTVSEERAELLAETLGVKVVREVQRNPVIDGAVERAAEQTQLFLTE